MPTHVIVLKGILYGFIGGLSYDVGAWSQNPGPYDYKMALRRGIKGAYIGLCAGLGISVG